LFAFFLLSSDNLRSRVIQERQILKGKVMDIFKRWENNKPVSGDMKPASALSTLAIFETTVGQLLQGVDQINRAQQALGLENDFIQDLIPLSEEIADLRNVWHALENVWQSIHELRNTLWSVVNSRNIRQKLDDMLNSTRNMPSRMRQYAAFEYVQDTLRFYLKVNTFVTELKSEALRERHWIQIMNAIRFDKRKPFADITLGDVWEMDLIRNESVIKSVILIAQGEMGLEQFLKQIKDVWMNYSLELVNYQNKCRLIKGWDELFLKCNEHLNGLLAMKHSPYYRVFEEEASSWEDKLSRVHLLFDVWVDVQRQWVYLEGIFSANVDIKHLLPMETARFQSINAEFINVLKKVYKSPFVLDVINIAQIQKSMERLGDLLKKIQKALGDYLEKERALFSRFYFIGDEDLLEIIGNSKDIPRIQKHFKKMFAGVAGILLADDNQTIIAVISNEGERLSLSRPIHINEYRKINEWLVALEVEIKQSLAFQLHDSVSELSTIYFLPELDHQNFINWIDKFPSQVILLSVQILWTQSIEKDMKEFAIGKAKTLAHSLSIVEKCLQILVDLVLTDLSPLKRKISEHLITELVHQKDVILLLSEVKSISHDNFQWLSQMRFYYNALMENPTSRLTIEMAGASFVYGFEYLGVFDKLVQTPLTDSCYLTLTQALKSRLGGSPFGPAGTGKTESVKALGNQLGRFVLVFCCDENFDFQAMGRIFVGLSQVGAWGCFDEFNRLEERILSAVSQQIQTIQMGLKEGVEVEVVNRALRVNENTGIFITMNPGYAGRSNLPDNLKKLFRSIAMTNPDREIIAEVMLYSQGFSCAKLLSSKIVPFFVLCKEQLSGQPHYDFGLRALKSVLTSAGSLKRLEQEKLIPSTENDPKKIQDLKLMGEQALLLQSIRKTVLPKLVGEDLSLFERYSNQYRFWQMDFFFIITIFFFIC